MSDPVFLRNTMANSVYAEQFNSAHLQGQQAARERAARLHQEMIKDEQTKTAKTKEAADTDVKERERDQGGEGSYGHAAFDDEELEENDIDGQKEVGGPVRHIDLTV